MVRKVVSDHTIEKGNMSNISFQRTDRAVYPSDQARSNQRHKRIDRFFAAMLFYCATMLVCSSPISADPTMYRIDVSLEDSSVKLPYCVARPPRSEDPSTNGGFRCIEDHLYAPKEILVDEIYGLYGEVTIPEDCNELFSIVLHPESPGTYAGQKAEYTTILVCREDRNLVVDIRFDGKQHLQYKCNIKRVANKSQCSWIHPMYTLMVNSIYAAKPLNLGDPHFRIIGKGMYIYRVVLQNSSFSQIAVTRDFYDGGLTSSLVKASTDIANGNYDTGLETVNFALSTFFGPPPPGDWPMTNLK